SASISYNLSKYDDETDTVVPALLPGQAPPPADQPQPGSTVVAKYKIHNSSLRPAWVFDSRDTPFAPPRGQKLSLAVEYAGGPLGGDNQFIRPEVGYSAFIPVTNYPTKTIFAFNMEGGGIQPTNNPPTNVLQRYLLGGEN